MNSLNHLLLPDHLPPHVTAQVSNPSPVSLPLLTLNQRVELHFFFWGFQEGEVSVLFIFLAGGGVKA